MDKTTRRIVGWGAIAAPLLHSATDILEALQGGFSAAQLWLNYAAFVPMPAVVLGLYAAQRPRIGAAGLWGALIYGGTFVYFAHTTLLALGEGTADYEQLWERIGPVYTAHGIAMIAGGLLFGWATLTAAVLPRAWAIVFLAGVAVNLVVGLVPVPEVLQTIGSGLRNLGLVAMGWSLAGKGPRLPQAT